MIIPVFWISQENKERKVSFWIKNISRNTLKTLKSSTTLLKIGSLLVMSRRDLDIDSQALPLFQRKVFRSGFFAYIASRKIVFLGFQIIDEHLSFLGKSFFDRFKKFLFADVLEKIFGYAGNFYHRRINFWRRRKISGRHFPYYFRTAISFDAYGEQAFPASSAGKLSFCYYPFRHFFLHHQNHQGRLAITFQKSPQKSRGDVIWDIGDNFVAPNV